MVGIGAANIAAGLVQGFPVSTSGSRTAVAEKSGARTQLTGVVGAVAITVMLLVIPGSRIDSAIGDGDAREHAEQGETDEGGYRDGPLGAPLPPQPARRRHVRERYRGGDDDRGEGRAGKVCQQPCSAAPGCPTRTG